MSRVGTIRNLETDGTHDILFLEFPESYPEGNLGFRFTDSPRKITGVQKVAQTFLYVLLTSKGSDPVKPTFGTGLSSMVTTGNRPRNNNELYSAVSDYVNDATGQTKAILNDPDRKDLSSQLDSVRLLAAQGTRDYITLTIKIVTRNGEAAQIAVPFPQLDL